MGDEPLSPAPPGPPPPRYSSRSFPPYRHVPGRTPHPRRDPDGHSRGAPEPRCEDWHPGDWSRNELWLWAVDCFNFGYWWECHEALEALWLAAGRTSRRARFVQAVLQVAAGYLHRRAGGGDRGRALLEGALGRLRAYSGTFLGVDVAAFLRAVEASVEPAGRDLLATPATIRLATGRGGGAAGTAGAESQARGRIPDPDAREP